MSSPATPSRPAHTVEPVLRDEATPAPPVRLADHLGSRASASAVCGEPVTVDGTTVIPVADIGFAFTGGAGSAAARGEGAAGGGARLRGYLQIKNGTVTYTPLRPSWLDIAVPLAALLARAATPTLIRRLTRHRPR
ncbi:spore germination protein GerW family protein [Streptomyces sp. Edi4]|uniref:spore germination protein GerW family protein n=1 Tax=Streptomyces sp. Edi4 TaxID=3162527 RepID=UPI003305ACC2